MSNIKEVVLNDSDIKESLNLIDSCIGKTEEEIYKILSSK